jgi:predicted membrane chloride channel (bestrophin family)
MGYLGKDLRSEIDTRAYANHFLDKTDQAQIEGRSNAALALMQTQIAAVTELQSKKMISDTLAENLLETASECIKEQGAAERLKTFPFPRQYAYFSNAFVWIFMLLLPFGMMDEMAKAPAGLDWMVIPFSTLISWIFLTMGKRCSNHTLEVSVHAREDRCNPGHVKVAWIEHLLELTSGREGSRRFGKFWQTATWSIRPSCIRTG